MARNIFISFRFSDGEDQKNEIGEALRKQGKHYNYSENKDRSHLSDDQIQKYIYGKLKETSVTIVVLTPEAVEYKKKYDYCKHDFVYDDWLYDELRYSLEDRENNRTNGIIAVYTKEAASLLFDEEMHICSVCNKQTVVHNIKWFDNLVRRNMMNVNKQKKKNKCQGVYDELEDSYCSLIAYEDFIKDINKYIENSISKRDRIEDFNIKKRMD